jgi:hypothetical protein
MIGSLYDDKVILSWFERKGLEGESLKETTVFIRKAESPDDFSSGLSVR